MHRYGNAVRPRQNKLAQGNNHVPRAEFLQANLSHILRQRFHQLAWTRHGLRPERTGNGIITDGSGKIIVQAGQSLLRIKRDVRFQGLHGRALLVRNAKTIDIDGILRIGRERVTAHQRAQNKQVRDDHIRPGLGKLRCVIVAGQNGNGCDARVVGRFHIMLHVPDKRGFMGM